MLTTVDSVSKNLSEMRETDDRKTYSRRIQNYLWSKQSNHQISTEDQPSINRKWTSKSPPHDPHKLQEMAKSKKPQEETNQEETRREENH